MKATKYVYVITFVTSAFLQQLTGQSLYHEMHRPQIHFSQKANWMNDPNGMVFYKGVYHLFFQYYPDSTVWGPNHWGHATSKDLVHWTEGPVALSPDSLGLMASGSAVVDANNTSGFGKNGKIPLVAIFTHINYKAPKEKLDSSQYQSIAYSLDEGKTWTKYANNPVVKSPGTRDFRDPKVIWYETGQKWVMTVATKDRVTFYSSKDLKNWIKESEFGKEAGAHGGTWECPDLFYLELKGEKIWVLMCSINPGGPNGGSATQYFIGQFDGKNFVPAHTDTRWVDYGTDNYAGVTWFNTGNRKIFLGWMSNWQYANVVPTARWRSAMTIPRELKLNRVGNDIFVISQPVRELSNIESQPIVAQNVQIIKSYSLSTKTNKTPIPGRIDMRLEEIRDFSIVLSNDLGEQVVLGYDVKQRQYYTDRTRSGKVDFHKNFAGKHVAPRLTDAKSMNLSLIIDVSSIELFADDGLSVMTEIFFPSTPYNKITVQSADNVTIKKLSFSHLKNIWY
ncbi:MAG: glycoside hydrolase family 32 protein [Chitinophagaceae bacterium]